MLALARKIVAAVVIIVTGDALSRAAQRLLKKAAGGRLPVDETVSSLLRLVIRYGIFIIGVIMILNVFGVNTSSLIAVLGA
ncbi:MAG: hypothetical protein LBD48_00720, partial [Treponema sp.]|nr:hypothetical protein [Treponema sp.]